RRARAAAAVRGGEPRAVVGRGGEPRAQARDRRAERGPRNVGDGGAARAHGERRRTGRARDAAVPPAVAMTVRAGFVSRMGAFVVDAAIVAVVRRTTVWILEGTAETLRKFAPPVDLGSFVLGLAPLLIAIYLVAFWAVLGQTPGKWLLGVKIVATGGGPVGLRRALVRLVGYVVSAIPCY